MKRTALFFSVVMLLSGVSAKAMNAAANAGVQQQGQAAAGVQAANNDQKSCCKRFKDCMSNTITCIKNHKARSLFVGAVAVAACVAAYKLYSKYKKNAEVEEVYEA